MKNLSIDTHAHDPADDSRLLELLKEGEGTAVENDEDKDVTSVNPDQYDDPEDSPSGDIDARWGDRDITEKDKRQDALHLSNAAYAQFRKGREELLATHFTNMKDKTDQKLVSQNLSHASSGNFSTSSPQLSSKSKTAEARPQTLLDQARHLGIAIGGH